MIFHILFSKKEDEFMDELSIEDRKYLFKNLKKLKFLFRIKQVVFLNLKKK